MRKAGLLLVAIAGFPAACGGGVDLNTNDLGCDMQFAPQYCPAQYCGNNRRNFCGETDNNSSYCGGRAILEPCDGADLGGATCQGFGWATGTLRCAGGCRGFDTSGCGACLSSPSVMRCTPPVPAMKVAPMAADIAATDSEVAMVWVAPVPDNADLPSALWFARLSPELDLIDAVPLDEPAADAARLAGQWGARVAIAPLPSGWAVAGWTPAGTFLHAIDGAGSDLGRIAVEGPTELPNTGGITNTEPPLLAAHPGAGPLMVWGVGPGAYRAAVVSADGTSMTAPVDITVPTDNYYQLMSAAFAGDRFYVVFMLDKGIRVARISTDGALLGVDTTLDADTVFYPFFVDGADQPRILYQAWKTASTPADASPVNSGTVVIAQDLGADAAAPSPPLYINTGDLTATRGVAFGTDMIVAAGGANAPERLAVARVDAAGAVLTAPVDVTHGAQINWNRVVRRGPDAVIAWYGDPAPLHVARVRP